MRAIWLDGSYLSSARDGVCIEEKEIRPALDHGHAAFTREQVDVLEFQMLNGQ